MPAKIVKTDGGTRWVIKSVRLANGNLLIPKRVAHDRNIVDWEEVAPNSSEYKRWRTVAVDEPDPRETEAYKAWRAAL